MKTITCVVMLSVVLSGCGGGPRLDGNVTIEEVLAYAPKKDLVIISVSVSNHNDFGGKVTIGAEVNAGTVTWREKQTTLFVPANATARAAIEFKGVKDRIPTMAKTFEYQVRLYDSRGKKLDETPKSNAKKPYGRPD